MILDGVWDHLVSHIVGKDIAKEMWDALSTLYQGTSEQQKMYLEEKLRCVRMQKGEGIDPFLTKIQEIRGHLVDVGPTPQPTELVQLALNNVSKEWQLFVQSILGRDTLPRWDKMWWVDL